MRLRDVLAAAALVAATGCDGKKTAPVVAPSPPPIDAPAGKPGEPQIRMKVATPGTGRQAKTGDVALVHLSIRLKDDGKTVADTRTMGEPQAIPVGTPGAMFPAMEQALPRMHKGERCEIEAPWQLGFGEQGHPGAVPPKADLVLDVEIVDFVEMKTETIATGSGPVPARGDLVLIHYVGTLAADGRQFDSSRERDEPILVPAGAGKVILGWDLILLQMKAGDRLKVTIPWQLAYGAQGRPPSIPGKADLVFDMERLPMPEIQTEVLAKGKGPLVATGQRVTVHYVGTLKDGTKFDSSRDRNEPFDVFLGAHQVIAGWEMALAKMHVGDRVKATIPWLFAYGAAGQPPTIPPKADLVFDIEVLDAK